MDKGADAYMRYLSGDDDAIGEIIALYKDSLIFFINGYMKNLCESEEIAETVFFRLAVKKPKYKSEYSFSTWLYTIGRNEAVSALRRRKRMRLRYDSAESPLYCEKDFEESFITEEKKRFVHSAMKKLPDAYREVLYLAFFEEMKNGDIARITGKSRKQVENLLFRAKGALKKELEKEGFNYENSF